MASQSFSPAAHRRQIRVWDLPLRLFHWLLVAAIALAFLSSEEGSPLSDWHIMSGWVAAVLIVFRIVWGLVGGEHSRWSDFIRPAGLGEHLRELIRFRPAPSLGHNPLGALSVLVLLTLATAVVWTGVAIGETNEEFHELLAWTLLALIAIHVIAVVVMSLLTRDNLIKAMITGRKSADLHPVANDAFRPPWYAFVLAALVLAGTIQGVRSFDALAFTPRSAEAYEHAAEGEGAYERGREGRESEDEDGEG